MPSRREAVFEDLLRERPSFHGHGGVAQWQLADDVLSWLQENVGPDHRTLETGCGYSTVVFGMRGCAHTVISPMGEEHDRIQAWCRQHGLDLRRVTFLVGRSERILPGQGADALDLVLIDGWHAFPGPFLDWFFTAERISVGGRVLIDDTQLRSVRILRDFLAAEEGRWRLERRFERSDVFCKTSGAVFVGDWRTQPYGAKPTIPFSAHARDFARRGLVAAVNTVPPLARALKVLRRRFRRGASATEQ
jgi:hypothetical protein